MKRFFIEDISGGTEYATIKGPEFRHLKGVLRLAPGARVCLFNGKGLELEGVIDTLGRHSARVLVKGKKEVTRESPLAVTLLQGLTKGEKPEFIVQKATELGVKEVVFYTTTRTVPVLKSDRAGKKLSRLRRVSIEAAKQCQRSILPRIEVKGFKSAIKGASGRLKIVLEKVGPTDPAGLKGALGAMSLKGPGGEGVALLVGPEGGLSKAELAAAVKEGFRVFSLGPRTLRAETAALSALAIIQYELGDMGG